MIENIKPAESLTVADFEAHPVWEFLNDDEIGETMVRPVEKLPVETLDNRIVGTQVRLANGGMGISRKFRRHKSACHPTLPGSLD
jgi:hypothetical protein